MRTQTTQHTSLVHTASRAQPNRTDSAWKTNLRYEMEASTLHAEPNRTEPNRAEPSLTVRAHWPAAFTRQPTSDSVAQ